MPSDASVALLFSAISFIQFRPFFLVTASFQGSLASVLLYVLL